MAKHIISASRRTDIPAYYSEWFMNRIRAGFCRVVNPLYPQQKTHPVNLSSDAVEGIVFWTRNPLPLMRYLDELDNKGYHYYFLHTLIGYPKSFDPGISGYEKAIGTFQALSSRLGPGRVRWRYDPIVFTQLTPPEWHQQRILEIAGSLQGFTEQMIFSFVIDYSHARQRYQKLKDQGVCFMDVDDLRLRQEELVGWIGRTLPDFGITPCVCADQRDWSGRGIHKAQCVDGVLISGLNGQQQKYRKDPAQRVDCCCAASRDIGANNTCPAGCFYCYASKDDFLARKQYKDHDPCAEYLINPVETTKTGSDIVII
jgi:hypothetical protein